MNLVSKTLYIPLYGKSYVSKKGIFLDDKKAEEIWEKEGFLLRGKSKSKWLAYYMGIRAAVFDNLLKQKITELKTAVVINIGCGLDSRVLRIKNSNHKWYDIDFCDVIKERKHYYKESDNYKMIGADVRDCSFLEIIPETKQAVVIMEGLSMYLNTEELKSLITALNTHFEYISLILDCYTVFAAKMSKYRNPINNIGITEVYGLDNPKFLENINFKFIKEHNMTPQNFINELSGIEKYIFRKLYAGKLSKKLYKLFEYKSTNLIYPEVI